MPRVSPCAAIVLALAFGTAAIGAAVALSLTSTAATAEIGGTVQVVATLPSANGQTVYLFAGTANGTTVVTVNGSKVPIPVGGHVFDAGAATFANGSATIDASIPDDSSLVGEKICWIAIVLDPQGHVIAIAKAGGPIIEDAIC
jgi:hypothetical protein